MRLVVEKGTIRRPGLAGRSVSTADELLTGLAPLQPGEAVGRE